MRGGQVSIEYLLVMGFSLLLLAPLLLFYASQNVDAQVNISEAQARAAGTALVRSAERVYYAGSPALETVTVRIPSRVVSFTVTNSSVLFRMRGVNEYDFPISSAVPLSPTTFSVGAGLQTFQVRAGLVSVEISES